MTKGSINNFSTMPLRFRVWDKNEKCFVPIDYDWGFAIRIDGGISHHHGVIDYGWQERFVISQDTGLKDNNGESIYTGDIIKINGYYVFVNFDYGCTFFENQRKGIAKDGNSSSLYDEVGKHIDGKIVGNIWQNSNLLEERE